jgi:hypothetical protein
MKAILFDQPGDPDVLRYDDAPDPQPGARDHPDGPARRLHNLALYVRAFRHARWLLVAEDLPSFNYTLRFQNGAPIWVSDSFTIEDTSRL